DGGWWSVSCDSSHLSGPGATHNQRLVAVTCGPFLIGTILERDERNIWHRAVQLRTNALPQPCFSGPQLSERRPRRPRLAQPLGLHEITVHYSVAFQSCSNEDLSISAAHTHTQHLY